MAARKKKAARRAAKAKSFLKATDPKSVVREGEGLTVSKARAKKAFKALKKLDPKSVVREGERKRKGSRKRG